MVSRLTFITTSNVCTMRLLDTETLILHEFESEIPEYAILSHRWQQQEITFKDVTKRRNLHAASWDKIRQCCSFVRKIGIDWVWIDTCCIDKRSSTELSEAINSMYNWYRNARVCIVHLNDVRCKDEEIHRYQTLVEPEDHDEACRKCSNSTSEELRASKWFTRGWTLQELIAPWVVIFVDCAWRVFGSRSTLNELVSDITGIAHPNNVEIQGESIATKMSWASRRTCTRSEDMAYSLMGLFEVNMPLLYGEGSPRAFRRLQLEILRKSDDETIFAWSSHNADNLANFLSPLAASPSCFKDSSTIRPFKSIIPRPSYAVTNTGLEIDTVLLQGCDPPGNDKADQLYFLPLYCHREGEDLPLALRLKRWETGIYRRAKDSNLDWPKDSELGEQGCSNLGTIRIIHDTDGSIDTALRHTREIDKQTLRSLQNAVNRVHLTNWHPD